MEVTAPPDRYSADQYVSHLAKACQQMGYDVHVHEPSTRMTIYVPSGREYTHETVTLQAVEDGELWWFWSWGAPMCEASKIGDAAQMIAHAVRG